GRVRELSTTRGTNCPQPVRSRVCGQVAHRLRTQIVHVREQSAIMFSPREWARPRTAHVRDQARTRTIRERATATSANYPQTIRNRVEVVRVNQKFDCGSPFAASISCSPCHPSALQI